MPFYVGKSKDGSDMTEVQGVAYVNPDNPDEWSSNPYPSQVKGIRLYDEVIAYMNGRYSLDDVYNQIQNKTCKLSRRLRDYVLSHYDSNGKYIKNE